MDKAIVFDALNSEFEDFDDVLQNFFAVQNGMPISFLAETLKITSHRLIQFYVQMSTKKKIETDY